MEVNYETEKKVIESLIFSYKKPISIYQINKEYEQHCGRPIPYLQLGFTSIENFILSLDESISSRYS
ncbi:hypothetical protein Anas_13834 [Armadillidium nasatum]|uniref:HTH OST-type domain-containing protein n=1 Tax=Armadillidium nasatum TaxID=96803 RepID=A0A5N5T7Q5_9CRUS|nr:hypothetical protein Anas_13834 [Armadillidium nasatum]